MYSVHYTVPTYVKDKNMYLLVLKDIYFIRAWLKFVKRIDLLSHMLQVGEELQVSNACNRPNKHPKLQLYG